MTARFPNGGTWQDPLPSGAPAAICPPRAGRELLGRGGAAGAEPLGPELWRRRRRWAAERGWGGRGGRHGGAAAAAAAAGLQQRGRCRVPAPQHRAHHALPEEPAQVPPGSAGTRAEVGRRRAAALGCLLGGEGTGGKGKEGKEKARKEGGLLWLALVFCVLFLKLRGEGWFCSLKHRYNRQATVES